VDDESEHNLGWRRRDKNTLRRITRVSWWNNRVDQRGYVTGGIVGVPSKVWGGMRVLEDDLGVSSRMLTSIRLSCFPLEFQYKGEV